MKPPYEISSKSMQLIVVISEKIGVLGALSTATASRDLRNAVDAGILHKTGDKMKTVYTKKGRKVKKG
jgi:hypothetical protein